MRNSRATSTQEVCTVLYCKKGEGKGGTEIGRRTTHALLYHPLADKWDTVPTYHSTILKKKDGVAEKGEGAESTGGSSARPRLPYGTGFHSPDPATPDFRMGGASIRFSDGSLEILQLEYIYVSILFRDGIDAFTMTTGSRAPPSQPTATAS